MAGASKRRWKRVAVRWLAVVLIFDRRESCTILEISRSGARVQLNGSLPTGTDIVLFCDRFGTLEAEVLWSRGELVGVRFLDQAEADARLGRVLPGLGDPDVRPAAPPRHASFGRRRQGQG
jgi:hypothetical protein